MSKVIPQRMTAQIDGGFVVFLIGMRINSYWKIWKWLPAAFAMQRMLAELATHPQLGLMTARGYSGWRNLIVIQYWRSIDHLLAYATDPEAEHLPAWRSFNRQFTSSPDLGVWHETYPIKAGIHESLYINMPPFGLVEAGTVIPATGRMATAKGRLTLVEKQSEDTA